MLDKLCEHSFHDCFLRHKKIKMDKTKLLNMLATKRSTFDSLYKKMEKIPDTLECGILWNIVHPWIWNIV